MKESHPGLLFKERTEHFVPNAALAKRWSSDAASQRRDDSALELRSEESPGTLPDDGFYAGLYERRRRKHLVARLAFAAVLEPRFDDTGVDAVLDNSSQDESSPPNVAPSVLQSARQGKPSPVAYPRRHRAGTLSRHTFIRRD